MGKRKKKKKKSLKNTWKDKMCKEARLIGLTGTNGAGKGEAAALFQKKGYKYFSLSDLIREELRNKGQTITRDNLIKMGNYLRNKFGPDILAKRVVERVQGKAIIDSIRNPREVAYLKKQKSFLLLAIDAPVEIRYSRVIKRGRQESVDSLQEFIAKEAEEMSTKDSGQQLQNCMKMADIVIINDSSLEDFHKKLEEFLCP
ncbi:MAG: AAA family ATPase [Candidatus Aminicenantes bacterium]|nr:AAA family ATPase [Candidatus Aminicenantes bacterium]